jgi:uncharacterized radical SAM superfamily protein
MMDEFGRRLNRARELSWQNLGTNITFYLPGMFSCDGMRGKYPMISITGDHCKLQCNHCRGKILEKMIPAATPALLVDKCQELHGKGMLGVLISGGCDANGELPWEPFLEAIYAVKSATGLLISIHSGLVDMEQAMELKQAGVDQALIDVIGDDETFRKTCRLPFGVDRIEKSMEALTNAGIPMVPHIVCGLDGGRIKGEKTAVAMISRFPVAHLVIVSLMDISKTTSFRTTLPKPEDVADVIVEARFQMPQTVISLGCARQRGNRRMETIAVDAGVNRLAMPSDEAIERSESYGLNTRFQKTCCSVTADFSSEKWQ